jgi:hypothetical protein
VYRSVALVDRSEYPTLVYDMDQMNYMNGLVGVAFIVLNHPYSRWGASSRNCTADGLRLGPGRSATLQWSILTSQRIHLTDQRLSASVTPCKRTALGPGRSTLALKFLLLNLSPLG